MEQQYLASISIVKRERYEKRSFIFINNIILILVLKGLLDYQLDGSISIISYLNNNFFAILAMLVYIVRFINFNK